MSLISPSSVRPATWTPDDSRCCSGVSEVRSRRSLRPITPLSGVRISWLMVARKSDFWREASIASSRASGHLGLRPLALGDPGQLLGDPPGHGLDQLVAVQRGSGGDRDDGVHLGAEQDRERDGQPRLVPDRPARVVGALGQLELRGGPRVADVLVAVVVDRVERLEPGRCRPGPARRPAPAPSRRAAAPGTGRARARRRAWWPRWRRWRPPAGGCSGRPGPPGRPRWPAASRSARADRCCRSSGAAGPGAGPRRRAARSRCRASTGSCRRCAPTAPRTDAR